MAITLEQLIEELHELVRRGVSPMSLVELQTHVTAARAAELEGRGDGGEILYIDQLLHAVDRGAHGVIYLRDASR